MTDRAIGLAKEAKLSNPLEVGQCCVQSQLLEPWKKDLCRAHSSDRGGEGTGSPITSLPYSTIKERYEIGEIEAIRRTHTEPSFLNLA